MGQSYAASTNNTIVNNDGNLCSSSCIEIGRKCEQVSRIMSAPPSGIRPHIKRIRAIAYLDLYAAMCEGLSRLFNLRIKKRLCNLRQPSRPSNADMQHFPSQNRAVVCVLDIPLCTFTFPIGYASGIPCLKIFLVPVKCLVSPLEVVIGIPFTTARPGWNIY